MSVTISTANIKYEKVVSFSVVDDFQSYTVGDLLGQGNWVQCNLAATIEIEDVTGDHRAFASIGGTECSITRSETFDNDQYAEATFDTYSTDAGVAVRCSGTSVSGTDCYFIYYGGALSVIQNDVWAGLDAGTTNFVAGNTIRLEIHGTTLTAYRNGSVDTTIGGGTGTCDVSAKITATPALASGKPGIAFYGTESSIDNWKGGNL
jgi:hypothetical protein